jgi:N-acetyl-anhydromuramyl-L-alanine amidase AmpD
MQRTLEGITPGLRVSVDWRPTPNVTPAVGRRLRAIVIHTAECGEVSGAAESLADWGAGPNRPKASWHFAVDCDSITQSVDVLNVAWHATSVNPQTIGIEHAGKAAQTLAEWRDPYSAAMLELSARLVAVLCERYVIPVTRPSLVDIQKGWEISRALPLGIIGHWDVTRAIQGSGNHTDPGPGFPWDDYLARVTELAPAAPPP